MRSIVTCMTSDHNKSIINNRSLNAFCCSSFHDLATVHTSIHLSIQCRSMITRHTRSSSLSLHSPKGKKNISRQHALVSFILYTRSKLRSTIVILWKLGRFVSNPTRLDGDGFATNGNESLPNFDKKEKERKTYRNGTDGQIARSLYV